MAATSSESTQEPAPTYCGHCGEKASSRCKACGNMFYCSVECQQADWAFHKLLCKQFTKFQTRPGENYRRAIMLPQTLTKPFFIWLPVDITSAEDSGEDFNGTGEHDPDTIEIDSDLGVPTDDLKLGSAWPRTEEMFFTNDFSLKPLVIGKQNSGELLDHGLWMLQRRDFIMHPRNQCVAGMVDEWLAFRIRGPIMFCGMSKVQDSAFVVDIDTRDFTLALDGLIEEHKKIVQSINYKPTTRKLKGVKSSAKEPHFEEVEVPRRHPAFSKGKPSEVAKLMQAGLRTLSYPSTTLAKDGSSSLAHPLNPAAYLHINVDVNSGSFGTIPAAVKEDQRSVLIVGDEALTGIPTVPMRAKAMHGLIVVVIKGYVELLLNDTHLTRQLRHDHVRFAITVCQNSQRLFDEYGSDEAVEAARGKEWRWGNEGKIVRM